MVIYAMSSLWAHRKATIPNLPVVRLGLDAGVPASGTRMEATSTTSRTGANASPCCLFCSLPWPSRWPALEMEASRDGRSLNPRVTTRPTADREQGRSLYCISPRRHSRWFVTAARITRPD